MFLSCSRAGLGSAISGIRRHFFCFCVGLFLDDIAPFPNQPITRFLYRGLRDPNLISRFIYSRRSNRETCIVIPQTAKAYRYLGDLLIEDWFLVTIQTGPGLRGFLRLQAIWRVFLLRQALCT